MGGRIARPIGGVGLPGATLLVRSLAQWAIARVEQKYEVSVLITMPVKTATGLARMIPYDVISIFILTAAIIH